MSPAPSSTAAATPPAAQWTPAAVITATGGGLFTLVLVLVGYIVASGTTRESQQLIGVDIGVGALLIAGGTAIGWLTSSHRTVRARQRLLMTKMQQLDDLPLLGSRSGDDEPADPERLVALRGARYFHAAGCPLIHDKSVVGSSRRGHLGAGRSPCGVCLP